MEDRTTWFRDAGYGLFVHWGLYAIPGGEWQGEEIPCGSEWIMKNARIPLADYRRLAEQFCPASFDARAIVRRAKAWGMRYVCVTAKHHDGFAMYDTAVSDWSVMHTPYEMPEALCRELRDTVKSCQPDCLINGRIGYGLGDYRQAADNCIPTFSSDTPWEVPATLNASWGYMKRDTAFRQPESVIALLVQVAGKGGNLLLNIGPDADGAVPPESAAVLDAVGDWLAQYGESILGTRAVPDFPYLLNWGSLTWKPSERRLFFHVRQYPGVAGRVLLTGRRRRSGAPFCSGTAGNCGGRRPTSAPGTSTGCMFLSRRNAWIGLTRSLRWRLRGSAGAVPQIREIRKEETRWRTGTKRSERSKKTRSSPFCAG